MSMEEKLKDPLLRPGGKRRRVSQAVEEVFPYEAYQDPLQEPMRDFHTRNDGQFDHNGFQIRREPQFQLWRISKDNEEVYGLNSLYTTVAIAQRAIDEHLKQAIKANNRKIRKTKEQTNGNETTENNKTPNG